MARSTLHILLWSSWITNSAILSANFKAPRVILWLCPYGVYQRTIVPTHYNTIVILCAHAIIFVLNMYPKNIWMKYMHCTWQSSSGILFDQQFPVLRTKIILKATEFPRLGAEVHPRNIAELCGCNAVEGLLLNWSKSTPKAGTEL